MVLSEIVRGLYIGTQDDAAALGAEFGMVVNCTRSFPFAAGCAKDACARIAIDDDPADAPKLFQVLRDTGVLSDVRSRLSRGQSVLVHCKAGVQRSPAFVACYLMRYHAGELAEISKTGATSATDAAISFVKARRPEAFFWIANLRLALNLYDALCAAERRKMAGHPVRGG
jgi:hypothetical protein